MPSPITTPLFSILANRNNDDPKANIPPHKAPSDAPAENPLEKLPPEALVMRLSCLF
jgi:hypothetical protein